MEEPSFVRCVKGTVDEDVQLLSGEREGSVHGSQTHYTYTHTPLLYHRPQVSHKYLVEVSYK